MITATLKVLLKKELKRITLNLCFILIITFAITAKKVKEATHFNDIKLQQFQGFIRCFMLQHFSKRNNLVMI